MVQCNWLILQKVKAYLKACRSSSAVLVNVQLLSRDEFLLHRTEQCSMCNMKTRDLLSLQMKGKYCYYQVLSKVSR